MTAIGWTWHKSLHSWEKINWLKFEHIWYECREERKFSRLFKIRAVEWKNKDQKICWNSLARSLSGRRNDEWYTAAHMTPARLSACSLACTHHSLINYTQDKSRRTRTTLGAAPYLGRCASLARSELDMLRRRFPLVTPTTLPPVVALVAPGMDVVERDKFRAVSDTDNGFCDTAGATTSLE